MKYYTNLINSSFWFSDVITQYVIVLFISYSIVNYIFVFTAVKSSLYYIALGGFHIKKIIDISAPN